MSCTCTYVNKVKNGFSEGPPDFITLISEIFDFITFYEFTKPREFTYFPVQNL